MKTYRKTGPPAWQRRLVLLLWGLFGSTLLLFAAWATLLWIEMDRLEDCTERGGQYNTSSDECENARWD